MSNSASNAIDQISESLNALSKLNILYHDTKTGICLSILDHSRFLMTRIKEYIEQNSENQEVIQSIHIYLRKINNSLFKISDTEYKIKKFIIGDFFLFFDWAENILKDPVQTFSFSSFQTHTPLNQDTSSPISLPYTTHSIDTASITHLTPLPSMSDPLLGTIYPSYLKWPFGEEGVKTK